MAGIDIRLRTAGEPLGITGKALGQARMFTSGRPLARPPTLRGTKALQDNLALGPPALDHGVSAPRFAALIVP